MLYHSNSLYFISFEVYDEPGCGEVSIICVMDLMLGYTCVDVKFQNIKAKKLQQFNRRVTPF